MAQLQTHVEALKEFLKRVKDCAQDLGSAPPKKELPLQEELSKIFKYETEKIKDLLDDSCNRIYRGSEESKYYFTRSIMKILDSSIEKAKMVVDTDEIDLESMNDLTQPLVRTINALMCSLIQAASVFSRKSFEAAFLVASKLEKMMKNKEVIVAKIDESEAVKIHSTWCALADRGCRLIPRVHNFDEKVKYICKSFENFNLEVKVVHDYLLKKDYSSLSQFVFKSLNGMVNLEEKYILTNYIVEHLMNLSECLLKANEHTNENIEAYFNIVFKGKCFLEYEVYSAFLEHGIPVIPRLRILCPMNSKKFYELDIITVIEDRLWLVEVTESEDEKELENKVGKLNELMTVLEAGGALVVCTRDAQEMLEQLSASGSVRIVTFGGLSSELQRAVRAALRSRRRTAVRVS